VSALAYARKIAETLTTILPYTLGLVLLPFSAEMAARRDEQALAATLSGSVRWLTILLLPVTIGLIVLRAPFIRLLLERGAFTEASTQLTAGPLLFYAVALLPLALEVIVVKFFFARQDTLTPVVTDLAAFALNIALIPPLMAALGLGGVALAAALAKGLKVAALLWLFGQRVPAFRLAPFLPFAGQMALAAAASAAVLVACLPWSQPLLGGQGFVALAATLAALGVVAGGTFVLVAYLLRVEELRTAWQQARNWRQRRHSQA
jgi:putative peptidoglycan lipid II flippase